MSQSMKEPKRMFFLFHWCLCRDVLPQLGCFWFLTHTLSQVIFSPGSESTSALTKVYLPVQVGSWSGNLETAQMISFLFHHTLLLWDTWLMQAWFTLCSLLEILFCVSYCIVFLDLKITSVWVNGKLQAEAMPLEMLFSIFQVENKFQPGYRKHSRNNRRRGLSKHMIRVSIWVDLALCRRFGNTLKPNCDLSASSLFVLPAGK